MAIFVDNQEFWAGEAEDVMVMYWYMIDDPQYMLFNDLQLIVTHVGKSRKQYNGCRIQVKYGRQVVHDVTPDYLY